MARNIKVCIYVTYVPLSMALYSILLGPLRLLAVWRISSSYTASFHSLSIVENGHT